jgi:hypothetical protein
MRFPVSEAHRASDSHSLPFRSSVVESWLNTCSEGGLSWTVVFEGTGQAVRTPDVVTDQAPAMCDALGEGPPGGALGLQRLELVTVWKQECDLECRSGGVVLGTAGGAGFPGPGHGERMDGQEHEAIIVASGRHHRPFLQFQADRDRASAAACAQGLAPGVKGCRAVVAAQELLPRSASDV